MAVRRVIRSSVELARATVGGVSRLGTGAAGVIGRVPTETADVVVIGAGVVGLAVARELAVRGRDVLVVETAPTFGTGTSSRNSEVIHAGIYYPPRSLKKEEFKLDSRHLTLQSAPTGAFTLEIATEILPHSNTSLEASLCVRGKELLYKYCSIKGIPHKQIGKLLVATRIAEIPKLEALLRCSKENRVMDLQMMEGSEAMLMEPELQCVKALFSPSTGIIDSHSFMLSLVGDAENSQTTFSYNTAVIGGHVVDGCIHLHISESKDLEKHVENSPLLPQLIVVPRLVINSAGLSALLLAKRFSGLSHEIIPGGYYARGCYFSLSKSRIPPFSHLIYPMPEDGGMGVHATVDLNGFIKFGPDVEWIDGTDYISSILNRFDYSVNSDRSWRFYQEIRKYFPNLKEGSLEPGYSGIRPKISGSGQPPADFLIQGEEIHGVPGLVNLFGIESPGLTSSLAIAEYVASKFS